MKLTTALVHNTVGHVVDLYGALLQAQEAELVQLRAQNAELIKQLARYARGAEVNEDVSAHGVGLAGQERAGQAVVSGRSDACTGGRASEGGGAVLQDGEGRKGSQVVGGVPWVPLEVK